MQLMNRPETRSEFEHRFHRLRELMREGKYAQMQGVGESILDVRYLPNGRLDFLSVDESARLQANTMIQFANFRFSDDIEKPAQEPNRT
jgi:hypothetical protein